MGTFDSGVFTARFGCDGFVADLCVTFTDPTYLDGYCCYTVTDHTCSPFHMHFHVPDADAPPCSDMQNVTDYYIDV